MRMKKFIKCFLLFLMLSLLSACSSTTEEKAPAPALPKIQYPYKASQEKEKMILTNMKKLTKGMPFEEVTKILGQPDEKTYIYLSEEDIKSNKPVSYCCIYLIQRNNEKGSMLERNEKLLRIHFDNSNLIIRTEKVGIK